MSVEDDRKKVEEELLLIRQEKLKALEAFNKYHEMRPGEFIHWYGWQKRVLELIPRYNIGVVSAPNKIGKCNTVSSKIKTLDGDIPIWKLIENNKPFFVWSWDGEKKVVAKASVPFKKEGLHKCYRITMSDGQWIESADYHRILTSDYGWRYVQHLYESFQGHRVSTLESYQSAHVLNDRHLKKTEPSCLYDYSENPRQCDELLPLDANIASACSPLLAYVQKHIYSLFGMDDLGNKYTGSLSLFLHRLSNLCGQLRLLGRHAVSLCRNIYKFFLRLHDECLKFPQLCVAGVSELQPFREPVFLKPSFSDSYKSPEIIPLYKDTNKIISIDPIGSQEVFDFEVEKYHNYFAAGMIHHNTACISNIASSWALGYEPWTRTDKDGGYHVKRNNKWYRKSTLGKEPPVKIRITGNDWRSHINETIVPELVKWLPKDKYDTRSDNGMVCKILFDNGSTIELLSHQEKFDVFESWIGDAWIPDEPPNKEIYDAMGRGLFLNNGKVLIFTTLLSQPWIVDELLEPEIPRSDVFLIDDLTFLDNDDLKQYDTELLRTIGYNDSQINEYFRVLLDFENKTKPQHLKEVDDYLKQCLNLN